MHRLNLLADECLWFGDWGNMTPFIIYIYIYNQLYIYYTHICVWYWMYTNTYSIYISEQKNIHQGASADVPAHAAAIGACEQSMQWQQVRHVQDASCSHFFAKIISATIYIINLWTLEHWSSQTSSLFHSIIPDASNQIWKALALLASLFQRSQAGRCSGHKGSIWH